ncbi:MAG: hypothetical protein K8R89_03000 [Anaerolineae bacterium]|nr:hypothetical protein [Anaerolineae bacterium]
MDDLKDLASLVEELRAGDLSCLPELMAALKEHSPEAVISVLEAHGLQITGDGNIVGSGNVAIVVKGEFPALAAQLARLAEQTQRAEQAEQAASLFGQAAMLLERGQVRGALGALAKLHSIDTHYPGSAELLQRAKRLRTWRRLGIAALIALGLLAVIWLAWSIWQENRPLECVGEIPVSEKGVLASAAQPDADGTRWWVGMSGGGLETFTAGSSRVSYDSQDLVADTVSALAVDEQNKRIWVGTSGGGLTVLSQDSQQADWRSYTPAASYTRAGKGGLPGCRIRSIYLDGERVYVGALDSDGLGILQSGKQWRVLPPPEGWKEGVYFIAYSMAKGPNGALWVGTNYGLYRLSGNDWSRPYQPPWDTGTPGAVRSVAVDEDGVIWIGMKREGLALYDERLADTPWIGPITTNDGLASDEVEAIALSPAGDGALIGTEAGLNVCRWKGGSRTTLECEVIRVTDLIGVPIHSLTISPEGKKVLVGTADRPLIYSLSALW